MWERVGSLGRRVGSLWGRVGSVGAGRLCGVAGGLLEVPSIAGV